MISALMCLATTIYFEARSEPLIGQRAVAEVIMNRVASDKFPDTVCAVVSQGSENLHRCQFSFMCDGKPETISENLAYETAKNIANDILNSTTVSDDYAGGALYYHANYINPSWAQNMQVTAQIGSHIFLRE